MGNISQSQRKNAIKAHAKYWEIEQAEELKRQERIKKNNKKCTQK